MKLDVNYFNCEYCLDSSDCGCLLLRQDVIIATEYVRSTVKQCGCIEVASNWDKVADVHDTNIFRGMRTFFLQSLDQKVQTCSKDRARRGYSPLGSENFGSLITNGSPAPNDRVEKFRVGPPSRKVEEIGMDINNKEIRIHFFPNDWSRLSGTFRAAIELHYEKMREIAIRLLRIIAFCFGLPPHTFVSHVNNHTSILSMNHYPPPSRESQAVQMAEHTDVSMISIICENTRELRGSLSGLQVKVPAEGDECPALDRWERVPRREEAEDGDMSLVVLIGDCLSDWTNGLLPAARHRVVMHAPSLPSSSECAAEGRLSTVFFFTPNYDAPMTMATSPTGEYSEEVTCYSQWRRQRVKRAMATLKKS